MPLDGIDAYPLYWPVGWKRTEHRPPGRYQLTFARSRDELIHTLKLMGVRTPMDIVISTNVPLRRDGLPYASNTEPSDPGVAVYWMRKGQRQVIACDRWDTVRANMRAASLALEGLRTMERCGATQVTDRAYLGFNALPADAGVHKSWREVLGIEGDPTESEITEAYRARVKHAHPDHGGSTAAFIELNNALMEARIEARDAHPEGTP